MNSLAFEVSLVAHLRVARYGTSGTLLVIHEDLPCTNIDPVSEATISRMGPGNFADLFETQAKMEDSNGILRGDRAIDVVSQIEYNITTVVTWKGSHRTLVLERVRSRNAPQ